MQKRIVRGDLLLNPTTKDIGLIVRIQRDGHQYERYEMYDVILGGIKKRISEYDFHSEGWKVINEKRDA